MRATLALTCLCENPSRRTGLSTLYPNFVDASCRLYPDLQWRVFTGGSEAWDAHGGRVQVCRRFPSNERPWARLWADHFRVAAEAKALGAQALITTGFSPLRDAGLPIVMQVFSLHHLAGGKGLRGFYRDWATRRGFARARLTIANSQYLASQLPVQPRRLLVSHEGLDTQRFVNTGVRGWDGVEPGYVLWMSNFYRYKRAELALAAYARLPSELRARHPFVLVGGDWEGGLARAEAAARELGIAHQVRFLGWVPDEALPSLYRGAAALVLSTQEESFGRSVLEAMACGTPVVVQALPVMEELCAGAAMCVNFTDTEEAASQLAWVLSDGALRRDLVARGLVRAGAFSFERLATERIPAILEAIA